MLNIIPLPKQLKELEGSFTLPEKILVKSDFELPVLSDVITICEDANIVVTKDNGISQEGYKLSVSCDKIAISASTQVGVYYAVQTIRQLCSYDLGKRDVPCCEIEDEPRFSFRGINLDVSRHFFDVDYIKHFLDLMLMNKLNVFHWHLTDDNGWRIEIKKYPLLTEIGSVRAYTQIGGWKSLKLEKKEYSGYYTQEQIKEVVAYAKARGITVIPEIDFPAHCASAIAAYNNLACRNIKSDVFGFFGGDVPVKLHHNINWNRTLCMGKDETFEFVYGVLDEVCELFDSPYIHVGGDEAPKSEWKKCPNCQRVMKENGLKNEEQLQGWFENKLSAYLKSKGRKLIGWNEVLKADNVNSSDKNIVVQYWTPERDKNAERYVNSGGTMIMSNHHSFYFDMPYAMYPLKYTYDYKPEDFGVTSENVKNVLGIEGELWTEWIRDRERLELLAFPRIEAMAEVAWTPEDARNYDSFKARLVEHKLVLEKLGVNYAVDKVAEPKGVFKKARIKKLFFKGNPYREVELNKEYRQKGDR